MKNLNDAIEDILKLVTVACERETVSLFDSGGRVCARDVAARFFVPPFDTSAMDGFAVVASDFEADKGGELKLRIVGEAAAGSAEKFNILSGEAVKIMTGAPLAAGADAILIKEMAREVKNADEWSVWSAASVKKGLHVRKKGADFSRGDVILPAGTLINSAGAGILASSGYSCVQVYKKRSVAVLSTGDELIDPLGENVAVEGYEPGPGKIMNSNMFLLCDLLRVCGADPIACGIASDTPDGIAKKIEEGIQNSDMIITTGGASVGSYDFIPEALQAVGFNVQIWKMSMKPGRPFIFGVKNVSGKTKLAFGLPGNPASSLVSFVKLIRPAVYKACGRSNYRETVFVKGFITEDVKRDHERTTYLRARLYNDDAGKVLISVPSRQDSNILTTALMANCLAEILPGEGILCKNSEVTAQII